MMKIKSCAAGEMVVFVIVTFLAPACGYTKARPEKVKNECIACHTDLNTIIRLSSEVAHMGPASGKSPMGAGEG